jgi:hypothetical protein
MLHATLIAIIAWLIGFDGVYHRLIGKVTVKKFARVECFDDRAIRELMYFGSTATATELRGEGRGCNCQHE